MRDAVLPRLCRTLAATLMLVTLGAAPERVDVLIRGGTVYTGSAAGFAGDVAIVGDRVRYVGEHRVFAARRTVDARGMVVAPGFIDPPHPRRGYAPLE